MITNKEAVLTSRLFRSGKDFTVRALCEETGRNIKAIGPLLQTLCEQNRMEKINKGAGRIAYRKTANSRVILTRSWVSTPTTHDFTPRYC